MQRIVEVHATYGLIINITICLIQFLSLHKLVINQCCEQGAADDKMQDNVSFYRYNFRFYHGHK